MGLEQVQDFRRRKDAFFKNDPNSPLLPEARAGFDGLAYYDYNPALDLMVMVPPFEHQETVLIHTTTDELRNYKRYGQFSFSVEDQPATLTLYETPHGFFLPFVDANAGTETYPAGRYIDVLPVGDDHFHVDFNLAYNPFCAYNPRFSCPLTPPENRLNVAIHAGERWQKPG